MTDLDPIERIKRDMRAAARTLSDQEARFLVDYYYICQEDRKRAFNQERALTESDEPHDIITWFANQASYLEKTVKSVLDVYTQGHVMGAWMRQTVGIGPIISAGMLAHIDIEKAPTVGHIWRFAGLDPTSHWEKGKKRPYNASLKTLCWKAGDSFRKFSGPKTPFCFYGEIYKERKAYEIERNERLGNPRDVAKALEKVGKNTEAYQYLIEGKLPPGQIDARARRYAVKLFLSHLHGAWYEEHFRRPPPLPYPIAHMGHAHMIESPTNPIERDQKIGVSHHP